MVPFSLILHPYRRLTRRLHNSLPVGSLRGFLEVRGPVGKRAPRVELASRLTSWLFTSMNNFLFTPTQQHCRRKILKEKCIKRNRKQELVTPSFFVVQSMVWVLKILKTMMYLRLQHTCSKLCVCLFLITQSLQSHNHSQTMSQ